MDFSGLPLNMRAKMGLVDLGFPPGVKNKIMKKTQEFVELGTEAKNGKDPAAALSSFSSAAALMTLVTENCNREEGEDADDSFNAVFTEVITGLEDTRRALQTKVTLDQLEVERIRLASRKHLRDTLSRNPAFQPAGTGGVPTTNTTTTHHVTAGAGTPAGGAHQEDSGNLNFKQLWQGAVKMKTSKYPMFHNVAGSVAIKQKMIESFMFPLLAPRMSQKSKGLLLYGPPGTGKTNIAMATANELGTFADFNAYVIKVRAADLKDKYIGNTSKNVQALFRNVRHMIQWLTYGRVKDQEGSTVDATGLEINQLFNGKNVKEPTEEMADKAKARDKRCNRRSGRRNKKKPLVILFMDEVESLVASRDGDETNSSVATSDVLVELDGGGAGDSSNDGLTVIATTNEPTKLDSAFMDRMSECIFMGYPNAVDIMEMHLMDMNYRIGEAVKLGHGREANKNIPPRHGFDDAIQLFNAQNNPPELLCRALRTPMMRYALMGQLNQVDRKKELKGIIESSTGDSEVKLSNLDQHAVDAVYYNNQFRRVMDKLKKQSIQLCKAGYSQRSIMNLFRKRQAEHAVQLIRNRPFWEPVRMVDIFTVEEGSDLVFIPTPNGRFNPNGDIVMQEDITKDTPTKLLSMPNGVNGREHCFGTGDISNDNNEWKGVYTYRHMYMDLKTNADLQEMGATLYATLNAARRAADRNTDMDGAGAGVGSDTDTIEQPTKDIEEWKQTLESMSPAEKKLFQDAAVIHIQLCQRDLDSTITKTTDFVNGTMLTWKCMQDQTDPRIPCNIAIGFKFHTTHVKIGEAKYNLFRVEKENLSVFMDNMVNVSFWSLFDDMFAGRISAIEAGKGNLSKTLTEFAQRRGDPIPGVQELCNIPQKVDQYIAFVLGTMGLDADEYTPMDGGEGLEEQQIQLAALKEKLNNMDNSSLTPEQSTERDNILKAIGTLRETISKGELADIMAENMENNDTEIQKYVKDWAKSRSKKNVDEEDGVYETRALTNINNELLAWVNNTGGNNAVKKLFTILTKENLKEFRKYLRGTARGQLDRQEKEPLFETAQKEVKKRRQRAKRRMFKSTTARRPDTTIAAPTGGRWYKSRRLLAAGVAALGFGYAMWNQNWYTLANLGMGAAAGALTYWAEPTIAEYAHNVWTSSKEKIRNLTSSITSRDVGITTVIIAASTLATGVIIDGLYRAGVLMSGQVADWLARFSLQYGVAAGNVVSAGVGIAVGSSYILYKMFTTATESEKMIIRMLPMMSKFQIKLEKDETNERIPYFISC